MEYRIPPAKLVRVSENIRSPSTKAKTSVTISRSLLAAADDVAGAAGRSALLERALRSYLRRLVRKARHERDLALIDTHAGPLNEASSRALADQADSVSE